MVTATAHLNDSIFGVAMKCIFKNLGLVSFLSFFAHCDARLTRKNS